MTGGAITLGVLRNGSSPGTHGVMRFLATFSFVCLLLPQVAVAAPRAANATAEAAEAEDEALGEEEDDEDGSDDVTDRPPPMAKAPPAKAPPAESNAEAPPAKKQRAVVVTPRAAESLRYADHLFLDGDYYRSITEYRRFLFLMKGRGSQAPRAALAIGEALLRGEQYDAAGRQLDGIAQRTTDPSLRRTALFAAGRAYLADGRPELAKPRLRLLSQDESTPGDLRREATWLLAWGHFDAGEIDAAMQYFDALAKGEGQHAKASAGVVEQLGKLDDLPQKNPLLAGALSIIPGGGHFYLGQWVTGVTSLVWNALFLFAAGNAFYNQNWGVGLVLMVFELGWYGGGIFGAIAGAQRYNRDAVRNWRDEILLNYGEGRDIPDEHLFRERHDAPPGTLLRFGGSF